MSKKIPVSAEQKEFLKVKRFVMKRFPGAHTVAKVVGDKTYYQVVDSQGFAVVDPELMIPPATSVRKAWRDAKYAAWFSNMIRKSNMAFNEEKMWKKLAKESGE